MWATDVQIKKLFSEYGTVDSVYIFINKVSGKSRGAAKIKFVGADRSTYDKIQRNLEGKKTDFCDSSLEAIVATEDKIEEWFDKGDYKRKLNDYSRSSKRRRSHSRSDTRSRSPHRHK